MEHIELAGIHSGDSACVLPPLTIPQRHIDTIIDYTKRIAVELNVIGLMNIQYAIANDKVYVLEANPEHQEQCHWFPKSPAFLWHDWQPK